MNRLFALIVLFSFPAVLLANQADSTANTIDDPLYKPFIERYILDEIKSLRQENQQLRAQVTKQIAEAKLESSDRAIQYTTSTINNIFYIITAAASLLVLLGWRSLSDIKKSIKAEMEKKIQMLTGDYESRLEDIEKKMIDRSKIIIETQQDITNTNTIHSLWMRAGLEKSAEEKISIYDEILQINPNDIEAMTYKADALLEIGEVRWALNLSNTAIELDSNYYLAFWQRACAYSLMNKQAEAIKDLKTALELSDVSTEELQAEKHFENLKDTKEFKALLS
ncbi:tetratricopeptide repeat protein [Draconibacterium halophilum]|uniref:Tetratricopeptide repeat protein n=1 Tax=Draconibacterium halophilum TaxID=2706887 RepID=A0A6C0RAP4_9BACT|nr:tetratricopeptide repeat protein [Draconibacterium halophilum]QIA06825.1 tetratricopeptide repeat protein [Draconibacterium halophilum]